MRGSLVVWVPHVPRAGQLQGTAAVQNRVEDMRKPPDRRCQRVNVAKRVMTCFVISAIANAKGTKAIAIKEVAIFVAA